MREKTNKHSNKKLPVIFDMGSEQCIWAQVGVVGPKQCHNAFDCLSCTFDKMMKRKNSSAESSWTRERWLATPAEERYCRHMLSGREAFKLCSHGYDCAHCAFDQMLDEELLYEPESKFNLAAAGGFQFARNYYYHPGHLWARLEYGGRVRVGIDDFAARLFGPSDGFELPPLGANISLGGMSSAFHRGGKSAGLVDPIMGVVVARNPRIMRDGELALDAPYGQGWLLVLEPSKLQRDLGGMISGNAVEPWLESESQRLSDFLTTDTGQRLAATGSRVLPDVYGSVPGLDWDHLVESFLRP
jgi:glycine cleavage system H lipoate-binding protein